MPMGSEWRQPGTLSSMALSRNHDTSASATHRKGLPVPCCCSALLIANIVASIPTGEGFGRTPLPETASRSLPLNCASLFTLLEATALIVAGVARGSPEAAVSCKTSSNTSLLVGTAGLVMAMSLKISVPDPSVSFAAAPTATVHSFSSTPPSTVVAHSTGTCLLRLGQRATPFAILLSA